MAKAIGLRVYKLSVVERGNPTKKVNLTDSGLHQPFYKFIDSFISNATQAKSVESTERTWFFDKSENSKELEQFGQVNYGTYGFESNFKNNQTKALNYRRKTSDVEEIPLYFRFSLPAKQQYGFAVFQSFQGRSCVSIVLDDMREAFQAENPEYSIRAQKLMPNDASGSIYNTAAVKRLKLITRNTFSDLADTNRGEKPEGVDVELSISARRSKSLGTLGKISKALKQDGILVYNGMEFDEAVAQVRVGKKVRPVGLFGDHSNAGVIDITESVDWGDDGHPTMASVDREAILILGDFLSRVSGKR